MRRLCLMVPFAAIVLAGCSPQPASAPAATAEDTTPAADASATNGLALADASVQLPAVPGRPAVAYFVLTVSPDAKGALVSAHVDHFGRAELHQSKMEGKAMTMGSVDKIPLVAGKPVVFAPGGYHVMLFDGDGTLKPGAQTELTLTLDNGDKVSTSAKVMAQGGDDMSGMKM